MPDIELNAELTEIVEARLEVGRKISDARDRFRRFAERKNERFERELSQNNAKCQRAVAKGLALAIPNGAFMGMKRPGVAVVSWSGPDPREPKKSETTTPAIEPLPEKTPAPITPMPVGASSNGDSNH